MAPYSSPLAAPLEILEVLLSLPNAEQLKDESFDPEELVERLTGALLDESQRNEILSLTGDNAILVIDCLDKVSGPGYVPAC